MTKRLTIARLTTAMTAACLTWPLAASAQNDVEEFPSYTPGPAVRNGFSADELQGAEVRGAKNSVIGEVEELIVGPKGELRRLVVAVNEGLFGTGGRRLAVDWDDVKVGRGDGFEIDYLTVPVTERNMEDFGLFKDKPKSVKGAPREWRASELLGDYLSLEDAPNFGSVTDLVFDRTGQLRMIAAAPDIMNSVSRTFYAPFLDATDGWDPGEEYYVLPYDTGDVKELLPPKSAQAAD